MVDIHLYLNYQRLLNRMSYYDDVYIICGYAHWYGKVSLNI